MYFKTEVALRTSSILFLHIKKSFSWIVICDAQQIKKD